MTSKKLLLMITSALFISLCSPICAEMTWQERVVRGANYGACGCIPYLLKDSFISDLANNSLVKLAGIKLNDDRSRSMLERVLIGATGVGLQKMVNKSVTNRLISESDRRKLGNKRFVSDVAAGVGAMLGDAVSGGHPLGSFMGALLFGMFFDHVLDEEYNSNVVQQLEKNTEENNKKRETREERKLQK